MTTAVPSLPDVRQEISRNTRRVDIRAARPFHRSRLALSRPRFGSVDFQRMGQEKTLAEQHGKGSGVAHGKVDDLVKNLHASLAIVQQDLVGTNHEWRRLRADPACGVANPSIEPKMS
jgi:hypothetical protein